MSLVKLFRITASLLVARADSQLPNLEKDLSSNTT
jgi:hypothetical protein